MNVCERWSVAFGGSMTCLGNGVVKSGGSIFICGVERGLQNAAFLWSPHEDQPARHRPCGG